MEITTVAVTPTGALVDDPDDEAAIAWRWDDVLVVGDVNELLDWGDGLGIDPILLRDAVTESDQPKYDNLGDHLALTIHTPTLADDGAIATSEIDLVLLPGQLVTFHTDRAQGIDWAMGRVRDRVEWRRGDVDLLLASVVDVICRRFVGPVEHLDRLADEQAIRALSGDDVVGDVATLRLYEADLRRVLVPLLVALDDLAADTHPLIGDAAARRMRDVGDVVSRLVGLLDSARGVLGDALAIYHGIAAHRMARATTVFTVYAAIMLPLTFITGFFGMNFVDLPGENYGWVIAGVVMLLSLVVSVVVFWRAGLLTPERAETPSTTDILRSTINAPIRAVGALAPRRRPRNERAPRGPGGSSSNR